MRYQNSFPLVADGEFLLEESMTMDLYEESDLISNIKGPYEDKWGSVARPSESQKSHQGDLGVEPSLSEQVAPAYTRRDQRVPLPPLPSGQKTQGQLAREAAREDLKRKKAASYLREERPTLARIFTRPAPAKQPEDELSQLTQAAQRLQQESYILADMPPVYSLEKEDRKQAPATSRSSYDFLKKSQVYNYPENRREKEYQLAQELQLPHIEEE